MLEVNKKGVYRLDSTATVEAADKYGGHPNGKTSVLFLSIKGVILNLLFFYSWYTNAHFVFICDAVPALIINNALS